MGDSTRDADADVIVSGREPRRRAWRPGGLVWLLVVAQAAALAVAIAVAVAHRYWMALDTSPVDPAPGLHGHFAVGTAAPFRGGQAPCRTCGPGSLPR